MPEIQNRRSTGLKTRHYNAGRGAARLAKYSLTGAFSERAEDPPPAHFAGMQDGVGIGEEALAKLAGLPGFRRNVEGHVDHYWRADDVVARDAAPEAAVVGIGAIVAHDEIAIRGNLVRHAQIVRLGGTGGVFLVEALAIDPNGAIMNVNRVAGEADDSLDVVGRVGSEGRLEDNDLLAFGTAPEGNVPVRERNPGVVADAAHDEVVADEQRFFHGAGRNDARLADGAVNQQENEPDPKPGNDFALDFCFHGKVRFCFFRFFVLFFFVVSFHDAPPPALLRARAPFPL